MPTTAEMVEILRTQIREARELYYGGGESPHSDEEYDALEAELRRLSPNDPLLKEVGSVPLSGSIWPKHQHEIPMGSLEKVKTLEDLEGWCRKVASTLGPNAEFQITEKLDGISLDLTYDNGKLVSAVTRGDGTHGDNITPNAKHIRGVLPEVTDLGRFHVRGEVVLPFVDFEAYWKPRGKANPRNTVSGVCKGRSPEADLKTLMFVAYDYYGDKRRSLIKTEEGIVNYLNDLKFFKPKVFYTIKIILEIITLYKKYDAEIRATLPWLTDGLVIRVNSLEAQDSKFTIESGIPTYAVAIKPSPTVVTTEVIGIEWNMGLSGRMCPVAQVRPTEFDGTILRNVNMFNLDFLYQASKKGFDIGALIQVERTGNVLPYYKKVVVPARTSGETVQLEITESERNTDDSPTVVSTYVPKKPAATAAELEVDLFEEMGQ